MKIPKGIQGLSAYPMTLSLMWATRTTSSLLIKPYQRPYSWSSEQIKTLFRDQFFPLANSKDETKLSNSFIGAIVILPGNQGAEVVDGQQRLTTLTMALGIACRMIKTIGAQLPESCRKFYKTYKDSRWIQVKPVNQECYSKIMDLSISKSVIDKFLDQNADDVMCNAADEIEDCIADYIDLHGGSKSEAIKSFIDLLVSNLGLVVVQVKSHDQALDVFQALNAGGMPLTLDQLVKSLILKTYEKLGSDTEKYIDDIWEGMSSESFYQTLKSPAERSEFLIYYYKAFAGAISKRSAYSNYKNWLEDEFKKASNKPEHCIELMSSLQKHWIFYTEFKPLLYQMGAKILIPVILASRERIENLGIKNPSIETEMHRIAFTLECGFSRALLMPVKLNQIESKVANLCRTLLKAKSIDELHLLIKDFYSQRAFNLSDNYLFRRSLEENKFKTTSRLAILALRRVNEALRAGSCASSHQISLIDTKAKFGAREALPYDKNVPNKFLDARGFKVDGTINLFLYKSLTQSIANLLLTSDLVTDYSRILVNKPYTKSLQINKKFLEKRGKLISSYASKIWSID
ncbi:MAG: DUF262 domain-containing protein [Alphaproteobacteria bacterium]|nr:DUF262 domain-containing protein [Alphaproteobacteria bacterium]